MTWTKVGSALNWKTVATSAGMLPVGPEPLWLVGEDGELMARVQVQGTSGYVANVTPEGKLSVDAQVTATVADSKIKGSPDNGVSWLPVKVDSAGQLLVAVPAGVTISGSNVEDNGILRVSKVRMMYLVGTPTKLTIPTYDGSGQAVHPSVVYIPQGFGGYKYWMAFTPYPNGDAQYENPSIVASNDGVTWVVPPGLTNPIAPSPAGADYNRDPELVYDPDTPQLVLYWSDSTGATYRSNSADGVTWSAPAVVTTIGAIGAVYRAANDWIGWAADPAKPFQLRLWTSSNGNTWSEGTATRHNLGGSPWHVSVFHDAAGYHFLLAAHPRGLANADNHLYYGFSEDGETVEFDPIPLLSPDPNSAWYSRTVYRSSMVPSPDGDQKFRIYVSAQDLNSKWWIGYVDVRPGVIRTQKRFHGEKTVTGYTATASVAASTMDTVADIPGPCTLLACELGTENDTYGNLLIYAKDEYGAIGTNYIRIAKSDGSGAVAPSPANVRTHGSDVFELLVDLAGMYKIGLKRSLEFPNGVTIKRWNSSSSTAYNISVSYVVARR